MLLRLFRFRESAREAPESLYDAEFRLKSGAPDLELSAYEIEGHVCVQTCLEHHASVANDPPRYGHGIDVAILKRPCRADPVDSAPFTLIKNGHRVLNFQDSAELLAFVTALTKHIAASTTHVFSGKKADFQKWLREERTDEWRVFLATAPADWKKYAGDETRERVK